MSDSETCSDVRWKNYERVSCRKPVNRNGMCGVHANGKEKREANRDQRAAELAAYLEASAASRKRAEEICRELEEWHIAQHVTSIDGEKGTVTLPIGDLIRILLL